MGPRGAGWAFAPAPAQDDNIPSDSKDNKNAILDARPKDSRTLRELQRLDSRFADSTLSVFDIVDLCLDILFEEDA